MRQIYRMLSVSLFILCLTATMAHADLIKLANDGFETGDFTSWSVAIPSGGAAEVVTSYGSYGPVEGNYFSVLHTDGAGSYTTIRQNTSLASGDIIKGAAAFIYGDYHRFNDNAYVHIVDSSGNLVATPWFEQGIDHPDYWNGPWTEWTWTAPAADTYTVVYGVANDKDNVMDSQALFDAAVPIPGSLLLMFSGLLGVLVIKRKGFGKMSA